MNSFTLGKYIPLNSIVHHLDPRIKMVSLLLFTVAIFVPSGWYGYLILSGFVLFLVFLAKLSLGFIFRAMKPMIFMLLFLMIVNIFVVKEGSLLLKISSFTIYSGAIFQTLYIVVRLALMLTFTTLLMSTTKPLDLTAAIEDLLKPLRVFKVPNQEIAMMISIALRFIPLLLEETARIRQAQASRGVDFEEGSIKEKIYSVLSLIVPLFSSAFKRAEDLSDAMEVRGYVPGKERTRYRELHVQSIDMISLFLVVSVVIVIAVIGWLL